VSVAVSEVFQNTSDSVESDAGSTGASDGTADENGGDVIEENSSEVASAASALDNYNALQQSESTVTTV